MKKIKLFFSGIIFLLISVTNINSQTHIIVDNTGSGDFYTLTDALANIKSYPDVDLFIDIKQGTYQEQVIIDSIGFSGFPTSLTLSSYSRDVSTTIYKAPSGLNSTTNYVFKIRNSNNVSIQYIQFQNTDANYGRCIDIDGFDDSLAIDQCQFTGTAPNGQKDYKALIYFNKDAFCSQFHITNNHFINGAYGIYSNYATSDGEITNNYFEDFDYNAIFLPKTFGLKINQNQIVSTLSTGDQIGISVDSSAGVEIQRNFIGLNGTNSNTAIDAKSSDSLIVVNNMFSLSGGGKNIGCQYKKTYLEYIFNNLYIPFGNNLSTGLILDSCNFSSMIVNNIFDVSAGYVLNYNDSYYSNFNLFNYNQQNPFARYKSTDVSSLTAWKNSPYYSDYQSFFGDPQYFSAQDLHVKNVALIEGRGDFFQNYKIDFDGDIRKNPPDIGADEIKTALAGTISKDTTLSENVFIGGDLTIEAGIKLTILPGTKISFADSVQIKNYGTIDAKGTKDNGIFFNYYTSGGTKTEMPAAWKGIKNFPNSHIILEYCSLTDSKGSAVFLDNAIGSHITNCFFSYNLSLNGGAIYSSNTNVPILNCDFYYNNATNSGGALYITDHSSVNNCVFYNNSANKAGDINLNTDTSSIINNTFLNSYSNTEAKSIEAFNSNSKITNNIFWGLATGDTVIYVQGADSPMIRNIDVFGGHAGLKFSTTADTSKIYEFDPQFVDNYTNFRLQPSSEAIDKGDPAYSYPTDKDNKTRPYGSGLPDLGAYEYQGAQLKSYAGKDSTICLKSINLYAEDPAPYKGTWSSSNTNINFQDINNPNTKISNLNFGFNELIWTVSDGVFSLSDTIIITEQMPPSFDFNDIYIVSKDYPNLITDTVIAAYDPTPFIGVWSSPDVGINILSPNNYISQISGLQKGQNTFLWTVDNNGCKNIDTLIVSSGFSVIPILSDSISWNKASTWNINGVPGLGDSVNISGAKIFIDGPNAECGRLVISSASHLFMNGSAKGPAVLNTDKIYVEQNPEKKYKGDDTARLTINNGQIYLKDASGGLTDGLIVGSKGEVIIDPSAGGVAEIHLGKNRQLKVKAQAVFKNAAGTGQIVIRNGGKIYVEQNAEKSNRKAYDKNVYVGSGGRIYVEQNAEKKASGSSELRVGRGNRIYVEQNAEKAYEGGKIIIHGGKIYVEQNAEKSNTKGSFYEVNIHRGGKIYVEQNPEKKYIDSSVLQAPRILIDNGQLIVGHYSNTKAKTARVHANKIYVEQNAEKQISNDSALIINSNASIDIKSTSYLKGELYLGANNALTIAPGGVLSFADSSRLIYQQNASIIDHGNNNIPATELIQFYKRDSIFYSLPFTSYAINEMNPNVDLNFWDESTNEFYNPDQQSIMQKGFGYEFIPPATPILLRVSGNLNSGDISVPLKMTNKGINLIGNPYSSGLLLNNIYFPPEVQNTIYFYFSMINNYIVIQQNGMNIFNIDPFLYQNEGFYVITNTATNFNFPSKWQAIRYSSVKKSTQENTLSFIFNLENGQLMDALGLSFKNTASNNYYNKEDALKLEPLRKAGYISCYTYSGDNKKLQINTLQPPEDNSTIPFYFISDNTGKFDINLNNSTLSGNVKIYLIDPITSDTTDLQQNQYYSFDYNTPNLEKEFLILFKGQITNQKENLLQTKIYSFNKDIYLQTSGENISKVEIFNITGIKVFNKDINSNRTVLKTNLENGIYIVKAYLKDKVVTQKIILN